MAGQKKSMEKTNQPRGINWVLTLNNHTQDDIKNIIETCKSDRYKTKYLLLAEDCAPTTGTKHIHGVLCFEKRHTLSSLKRKMDKCHFEQMRGTIQQAIDYTTKYIKDHQDAFCYNMGTPPKDTKFTTESNNEKWELMFNAAKKGKFEQIPPKEYIRYHKAFREIYIENQKAKDMPANLDMKEHFLWLWGSTGNGKSYAARHEIKDRIQQLYSEPIDIYLKTLNKWWDHYQGEKIVLIEEANPDACEHLANFFKTWLDEYAFVAEAKGAIAPKIRPEFIIITSNYTIDECFPKSQDSAPLKRRLREICMDNMLTGIRMNILWPSNEYIEANKITFDESNKSPATIGRGRSGSVGNTSATDPVDDVIIGDATERLRLPEPLVCATPMYANQTNEDTQMYLSPLELPPDENAIINPF